MLDCTTTFDELSDIFNISPDKFYSRPSFAKYIENKKKSYWIWECKIGFKAAEEAFNAHLNETGVLDIYLTPKLKRALKNSDKLMQLKRVLNSYDSYLIDYLGKMDKVVNSKKMSKMINNEN